MVGVSKIDQYQLGSEVRKLNLKYPGEPQRIAEIINENHKEDDIKLNRHNVGKWLKKKGVATQKNEIIEELTNELMIKDQDSVLAYHNEVFQAERENIKEIIVNPDITPQEKLDEIRGVYSGSLGRTLDSFGYNKQNNVQQVNIFNIDSFKTELKQIIIEETNNNGERVVRQRIIDRIGRMGGVI